MERKNFQNNWSEMRDQISEWWDDLTEEDLDVINGNQEQLIAVLQERYGYTRNLAFVEVKIRMASYHPESERTEYHSCGATMALQYSSYNNDNWSEINNNDHGYGEPQMKVRLQELTS